MSSTNLYHRDNVKLWKIIFWLSFALAMLCLAFPPFRYLAYGVPVFALLSCLAEGQVVIEDEAKPFIVILLAGILLFPLATSEGWKDLFFIFAGVSVAMMPNIPRMSLWLIFTLLFIGFCYLYGVWGDFSGGIRFDFMNSLSSFEGNFSFVFALLVPFAWSKRRYLLASIAFFLAVLSLKRIALLAAIAATLLVIVGEKRGKWILNPLVMISLNLIILAINMAYVLGDLNWLIQYVTGQSANAFGMGRQSLQYYVVVDMLNHPFQTLLGNGVGAVYELAQKGLGTLDKVNLHSDVMKIVYELGCLTLIVCLYFMYKCKLYMHRVGFAFMNVMFLTDNTLIYFFFTYFFFLILRAEREGKL